MLRAILLSGLIQTPIGYGHENVIGGFIYPTEASFVLIAKHIVVFDVAKEIQKLVPPVQYVTNTMVDMSKRTRDVIYDSHRFHGRFSFGADDGLVENRPRTFGTLSWFGIVDAERDRVFSVKGGSFPVALEAIHEHPPIGMRRIIASYFGHMRFNISGSKVGTLDLMGGLQSLLHDLCLPPDDPGLKQHYYKSRSGDIGPRLGLQILITIIGLAFATWWEERTAKLYARGGFHARFIIVAVFFFCCCFGPALIWLDMAGWGWRI